LRPATAFFQEESGLSPPRCNPLSRWVSLFPLPRPFFADSPPSNEVFPTCSLFFAFSAKGSKTWHTQQGGGAYVFCILRFSMDARVQNLPKGFPLYRRSNNNGIFSTNQGAPRGYKRTAPSEGGVWGVSRQGVGSSPPHTQGLVLSFPGTNKS